MSEKSKIINFQSHGQRAALELPPVLADLKSRGWGVLSESVHRLMENADDALFELADRALNANEQNLYFEAMREIRVQRRQLEQNFEKEIIEGFRGIVVPQEGLSATAVPVSSLELLEYDDMEEQVAVESMATKAEKRFAPFLGNLRASLSRFAESEGMKDVQLTDKNVPLGPLVICKAFASVCRHLDIEIKPKLVLFKLFDRHVVAEFGDLYRTLEEALQQRDMLVEAEARPARNRTTGEPARGETVEVELGGNVFDVLKALVEKSKVAAPEQGDSVSVTGKILLSKSALLSVLQELQICQLERLASVGIGSVPENELTQLPADLAEKLQSLSEQQVSDSEPTLAQRDFDIINLVALLFQYLLEDSNLAAPMKGLIAHMQIPVLKVAMLDKSFFSKDGHPARILLNKIADSCIGWAPVGDCEDDPLYIEVERVVRKVLGSADGNSAIFSQVLDEFTAYLEKERRRAELVTKRMLDAEGNRAVADAARAEVDRLLRDKIAAQEHAVPKPLETLLLEGWSKVLFLQHVQQGTDSDAWNKGVALADRLLWSVSLIRSPEQRDELLRELPDILEALRAGLNQVGFNPYEMKQLLHELEGIHLQRLKKVGKEPAPGEAQNKAAPSPRTDDSTPDTGEDLESLDASIAETLGETNPQLVKQAEQLLAKLQVGTWMEFAQPKGKKLRCRLAAVIASTGKHIFVNRSGVKVAEYSREQLIEQLVTDKATLMDDSMLFDKALESVISNLRDMKDKPI